MRYVTSVQGSQAQQPDDFERNGERIYSRGNIQRITETDEVSGEKRELWQYDEIVLTKAEYDRLLALDSSFITEWSDAARNAERRARYERMDVQVSRLRRRIALGDTSAQAKLKAVQEYCEAVSATQKARAYPLTVEYPEEPAIE